MSGDASGLRLKDSRTDLITAEELADELGTEPTSIYSLIDHGYVESPFRCDFPDLTLVIKPPDDLLRWLRLMFTPINKRPVLPIGQAARMLGVDSAEMRNLCIDGDVELYFDPVFGELISLTSMQKLYESLALTLNPIGFDRQSLFDWFARMLRLSGASRSRTKNTSKVISEEITRIANLDEPARTMRAAEFWSAYCDARDVAECLRLMEERERPVDMENIDVRMTKMYDAGRGRGRWPGDRRTKKREKRGRNYEMRMAMNEKQREEWELAKHQSIMILGRAKDKIRKELGWAPLKRRKPRYKTEADAKNDSVSGETGTTPSS